MTPGAALPIEQLGWLGDNIRIVYGQGSAVKNAAYEGQQIMPVIKDPEHRAADVLHKLVDLRRKRVLEIGCGHGRLAWRYAARTLHVTAIDPSAEDIVTPRCV